MKLFSFSVVQIQKYQNFGLNIFNSSPETNDTYLDMGVYVVLQFTSGLVDEQGERSVAEESALIWNYADQLAYRRRSVETDHLLIKLFVLGRQKGDKKVT